MESFLRNGTFTWSEVPARHTHTHTHNSVLFTGSGFPGEKPGRHHLGTRRGMAPGTGKPRVPERRRENTVPLPTFPPPMRAVGHPQTETHPLPNRPVMFEFVRVRESGAQRSCSSPRTVKRRDSRVQPATPHWGFYRDGQSHTGTWKAEGHVAATHPCWCSAPGGSPGLCRWGTWPRLPSQRTTHSSLLDGRPSSRGP